MMRARTLALAAALCAFAPAAAQAAPTWQPVKTLTPNTGAPLFNDVGNASNGSALLAWRADDRVNAMSRNAGTTFGTQVSLGAAPIPANASEPRVSVNSRGDAFVAWCQGGQARLASRPAGGLLRPLEGQPLGDCTGADDPIDVAARADGSALVAWERSGGPCTQVVVRERAASGALGATVPLHPCPGNGTTPRVAQNAAGAAAVIFIRNTLATVSSRAAGGSFMGPFPTGLAAGESPAVAIAPNGLAAYVWLEGTAVQGRRHQAGSATVTGGSLSGAGAGAPDVAIDGAGNAVAAWAIGGGDAETASAFPGGAFNVALPVPGSAPAVPGPVDVEFGANRSAVLVFTKTVGGPAVHASVKPPGAAFQPARGISGATASAPHVAVDGQGNATAIWSRNAAGAHRLEASGYDAAPPGITSFRGPPTGVVGQPLTFAASAFDVWSAFSLGWSFGDGTGATGGSVAHVYTRPGTFTVRVTANDAVGNAASASRSITIVPPPRPDLDGDGFRDDQDCNDNNAKIFPGGREIRGNRVDEDCNGVREDYRENAALSSVAWALDGSVAVLIKFQLKQLPRRGRAEVRCRGKRCEFKRKSLGTKRRGGTIKALRKLKRSQRRFRAGQTLEVRITAPGYFGKVVRYPVKAGKVPVSRTLCLEPGKRKPKKRCG